MINSWTAYESKQQDEMLNEFFTAILYITALGSTRSSISEAKKRTSFTL